MDIVENISRVNDYKVDKNYGRWNSNLMASLSDFKKEGIEVVQFKKRKMFRWDSTSKAGNAIMKIF